jgi:glycosyltransferase involved in cell wall biosynthesis
VDQQQAPEQRTARRREVLAAAGLPYPARRPEPKPTPRAALPPGKLPNRIENCLALIATRNFLPAARLTARGFLAHHPEFKVCLLLVDGTAEDVGRFTEGLVICLDDLRLHDAGWYAAKFTAAELANALKPVFLRYLAGFVAKAIYLDCDIAVFSRLTEMIDLLSVHDMVLLPHMLAPVPRPEQFGTHPTRSDIFNSGLINAGCFALHLSRCGDFLAFWQEATLSPGAFFAGAGYQTDQQYLNWALVMMPGACVLRDQRYNVAYWNLHDRNFHYDPSAPEGFLVDHRPLAFFHFSGYDVNERFRLSRHDQRHSVYNLPTAARILNWYSDQILADPDVALLYEPYRFDRLANGLRLTPFLRNLLKRYELHVPRCDPYMESGADTLCAFLMTPLPAAGSLLPLIGAEIYDGRPDLQKAFPNAHTTMSVDFYHWFCRYAGTEHDVQLLIDRYRRVIISDSVYQLAETVAAKLRDPRLAFMGADRQTAALQLRIVGEDKLANSLLESVTEWQYASDASAALTIYAKREDLRNAFPDVLGRDHKMFCKWLIQHATAEHGCLRSMGERFQRYSAPACLARLFNYLSRRDDVASTLQDRLLADEPDLAFRRLIEGAGDGLEYDLDDVVVLMFIHQNRRDLLVPLYLELPLVRQRAGATRSLESSLKALPEQARASGWAMRGCQAHAACFDGFEAVFEDEVRHRTAARAAQSRGVFDLLREKTEGTIPHRLIESSYHAAALRAASDQAEYGRLKAHLTARSRQPGVNILGYFHADIGVGESTRGLARAVARLRPVNAVPLCTSQLREDVNLPELFRHFDYLTDTNIFVSYPHQQEDLLAMLRPEQLAGRRNVAYLAWEQRTGNPWWKVVYDRYDEIWTISDFAATSFRELFPGRVRVVPNVLDYETFPAFEDAATDRLARERTEFLFAFDANSSMERKNPEGTIDAFAAAFKDTDWAKRVRLTLKVGGMNRPEHAPRVRRLQIRAAETGLAIQFDDRQLPRNDMLRMIAESDCYLSLHRAEGFGYTLAEAMYYGVPVIASGYSGNLQFMTQENSYLVPCQETFVKDPDGPFQRGSVWGEPYFDIAVAMLRWVVEQPTEALARGQRGRATVVSTLSAAAVAGILRPYFGATAENEVAAHASAPRDPAMVAEGPMQDPSA